MSSLGSVVTRGLITLIHISTGVAAGIGVIYSLSRWGSLEGCLPPMAQLHGGTFTMKSQLPDLCDCVFISLVVVVFLNLSMCAFVNCLWKYRSTSFLIVNMFVTLVIAGFSVFAASMMTTYRMIWCDVISQKMSDEYHHFDCSGAATEYARTYESRNMTSYYDRIELQMLGLWALVPLTIVIIVLYGVAVNIQRWDAGDSGRQHGHNNNYQPVVLEHRDVTTPLTQAPPPNTPPPPPPSPRPSPLLSRSSAPSAPDITPPLPSTPTADETTPLLVN